MYGDVVRARTTTHTTARTRDNLPPPVSFAFGGRIVGYSGMGAPHNSKRREKSEAMNIEKLRIIAGHAARIEPGDYIATCVAVHPPIEFSQYERMSQRIDFAIEGDGTVLKKYCNLGPSKSPWKVVTPKSQYYKVWTAAMGRRPEPGEPITLDAIVGTRCRVTVVDKEHKEHGYIYSVVDKVRAVSQRADHPENPHCLNASASHSLNVSVPQHLSHSATQDAVLEMGKPDWAVDSGTQDVGRGESQALSHSATQDRTSPTGVSESASPTLAHDKSRTQYKVRFVDGRIGTVLEATVAEWKAQYPDVNVEAVARSWCSYSQTDPFQSAEHYRETLIRDFERVRAKLAARQTNRAA